VRDDRDSDVEEARPAERREVVDAERGRDAEAEEEDASTAEDASEVLRGRARGVEREEVAPAASVAAGVRAEEVEKIRSSRKVPGRDAGEARERPAGAAGERTSGVGRAARRLTDDDELHRRRSRR
jgi:hypothetical protein